jgi:hypothetical protein
VTHNLYQPQELAKVRAEHGAGDTNYEGPITTPTTLTPTAPIAASAPSSAGEQVHTPPSADQTSRPPAPASPQSAADNGVLKQLADELATLKREFAEFREQAESQTSELRRELDDLKTQLGA